MDMYNKIIATALMTCLCIVANEASASNTSLITTNGFYVGGALGVADFLNKESHSVEPESHQLGSLGAVGGVLAGYDYGINNWSRVAVEGFVELTDLSTSISHGANTYTMNQDYNLGIRLLPEYVFTPFTVGHLILGYVNGRFHINDNGVYGLVNTTFHQSGFQTGLGLVTTVRENIFVRIDALYDGYGSNTNTGTGIATPTQSYTNRFSQLAGEFALIYKFC
jgi:opacity protein-like surface antigen